MLFLGVQTIHTGRFKVDKTTLAIDDANGKPVAVSIPAGDIVKVLVNPSAEDNMVDVLWKGRTVALYVVDLKQRGIETQSRRAISDWLPPDRDAALPRP